MPLGGRLDEVGPVGKDETVPGIGIDFDLELHVRLLQGAGPRLDLRGRREVIFLAKRQVELALDAVGRRCGLSGRSVARNTPWYEAAAAIRSGKRAAAVTANGPLMQ